MSACAGCGWPKCRGCKLVTKLGELESGIIVVVKGCGICSGTHRGILLSPNSDPSWDVTGTRVAVELVYPVEPKPACVRYQHGAIGQSAVDTGKVFRVVDGMEHETATETSKPLERVR